MTAFRFWKSRRPDPAPPAGLPRCRFIYGGTRITPGRPAMRRYRDAIFVPKDPDTSFADDPQWGLYDSDGVLIDAASYTRGLERIRVGQSPTTAHRPHRLAAAVDAPCLYAGPFHFHFGHFLLATLGRLWPLLDAEWRGARIVCHGRGEPADLLRPPFARDVAAALGLGPDDFAHFGEPVRLPEVLVPEPCLDEDQSAHAVYAELGATIGARLQAALPSPGGRTAPVYLSKSRLAHGVWRFRNEADLDRCLIERGIDVVYPETLGLAEQVRLFETREVVLASAGSALHTSILARRPARSVGLARSGWIHSSQIIIDRLRGNRALYLDLTSVVAEAGPGEGFGTNLDIASPATLADQLVRAVDTVRRTGTVPDPADYEPARFPG